ncbi:MAG: hypothetical protein ABEJ28_10995 [Salinigranum sp.]
MPDRVPSDSPSVTTLRASLARSGGTRKPCLRLPDGVDLEPGDLFRLVLDGRERHARVDGDASGALVRGAYDNRRLARNPGEGENRLVEWCRAIDRGPGEAVELDEVDPGYLYGLRVPGKRAVYEVTRRPDESLAAIAERLDGEDA